MKNLLYHLMLILCFSSLAEKLNTDQLKDLALKNNFSFQAQEQSLQVNLAQKQAISNEYFPEVGVRVGQERVYAHGVKDQDNIAAFFAQIDLLKSLGKNNKVQLNKLENEILKNNLEQNRFLFELQFEKILNTYFYFKERKKLIVDTLEENKKVFELAKRKYEASLIPVSAIMKSKLREDELQLELDRLRFTLDTLYKKILSLCNLNPLNSIEIEGKLSDVSLKNLEKIKSSPTQNRSYQNILLQIKDADLKGQGTKYSKLPSLNLSAEAGYLDERETGVDNSKASSRIALIASWNFLGSSKAKKDKEVYQAQKVYREWQQKEFAQQFHRDKEAKVNEIQAFLKSQKRYEKNERSFKKLYTQVKKEFNKGVVDSFELSSVQDKILEAQQQSIHLKFQIQQAKTELEEILGEKI